MFQPTLEPPMKKLRVQISIFGCKTKFSEQRSKVACTPPYTEYIQKRENGKCFHCELAYAHEHWCTEKKIYGWLYWLRMMR